MKASTLLLSRLLACITLSLLAFWGAPACRAQQPGGRPIGQGDLSEFRQVLNPGKADDWPLDARDGETVILGVRSAAFDPVVELVGPNDAVVAANDDVRPGVKDALLLHRIAMGGAYRVRVRANEGTAAGSYDLAVRRFVASDVPLAERSVARVGRSLIQWHRVRVEAGRTPVVSVRAAAFAPAIEVFAPNGEPVPLQRLEVGQRNLDRAAFRATQGGDHYVRVTGGQAAGPGASYAVTVALARVFETAPGRREPARRLDAGGLDLWTFEGKPGDLIRIRATAPGEGMLARFSFQPPVDEKTGQPRRVEGPVPPFALLPTDPKRKGEVTALLNRAGRFQVDVSQLRGLEVEYTLATDRPLKDGPTGDVMEGRLPVGDTDTWAVSGAPGRILRFDGASDQFDLVLSLFSPHGERVALNDDGGEGRSALLTALALEEGTFLLRVQSLGNGGGGAYRVRQVANPGRPLAAGAPGDGTVGPGGTEIWSFQGKAGQALLLNVRSTEFDPRVAIFGPDGAEVPGDEGGSGSLMSLHLPVDGSYTVWVSGSEGGGRYSLYLFEVK